MNQWRLFDNKHVFDYGEVEDSLNSENHKRVQMIEIHPNSKFLFSLGGNGKLMHWSIKHKALIKDYFQLNDFNENDTKWVVHIKITDDGNFLFSFDNVGGMKQYGLTKKSGFVKAF